MVWDDQKDELLCRDILLLEPYKFKARTREKGDLWKAISDNLNSLDGFKVDVMVLSGLILRQKRKKKKWPPGLIQK